jgi:acyl carrier protein
MNRSEIINGVYKCVSSSLATPQSSLAEETRLVSDLNADSLDIMDIIFQLEEEFSIKLEKEDFNFLLKVGMDRDQAVKDGLLTLEAKTVLKTFMPSLELEKDLRPADLSQYLSLFSIVNLVQEKLSK